MKRIMAAAFFALLPVQGFAKDQLKKFRWAGPPPGQPRVFLGAALVGGPRPRLLPAVGEFVSSERQQLGPATLPGTWRQTIFTPDGEVSYSAGAWMEGLPSAVALGALEQELRQGLNRAINQDPRLKVASRIFPPRLEVRQDGGGEWAPYWRVEYLTSSGDRLRYLLLEKDGRVSAEGDLDWDGADGRALVFPRGPLLSQVEEASLYDLSGDGTLSGRLLRVFSALDLKVWSPELTFFFAQDDRRFDLGQAYYTIDQGFRWMKEHLGVEIDQPLDVRLHVGDGGVSNAAFYHQNTIYLGTGDGVVYKDLIRDPSVLIHEGIHSVIDAYVGLPSEGEGGSFNEGFADLFTALILDNPRMGEASYQKGPYRRTLENQLRAYRDFGPGVYQNGSIVGATFWDMKIALGVELTAKLAFRTLVRLGKGGGFDDFGPALASAAEGILTLEQTQVAMNAARARGWKVP